MLKIYKELLQAIHSPDWAQKDGNDTTKNINKMNTYDGNTLDATKLKPTQKNNYKSQLKLHTIACFTQTKHKYKKRLCRL